MNEKQVRGSFGTVEYSGYSNEIIEIPLEFEEPVRIPSKTVFDFTKLSGDEIYDFDYGFVGIGDTDDKKYRIGIRVPEGRQGTFQLELKYYLDDPVNPDQHIVGSVEPITVEYKTSSVHERVERLEKIVLLLLQSRSSQSSRHNKSVKDMMANTFPASVEWLLKLLHECEGSEKTIEQYYLLLEDRLDRINKD